MCVRERGVVCNDFTTTCVMPLAGDTYVHLFRIAIIMLCEVRIPSLYLIKPCLIDAVQH